MTQPCSTGNCNRPAAFTTRSRPAWCVPCMAEMLDIAGLAPAGPFPGKPGLYWRTRCLTCATVADYRLEYVLEKNAGAEPTCRVCYWIDWAAEADRLARRISPVVPNEEIRALADASEYDVANLVLPQTRFNEPVVLECRACGRLDVMRVLDIHRGCPCSRARRQANEKAAREARRQRRRGYVEPPPVSTGAAKALAQSDLPAVAWWDHDANPEALFEHVFPAAKKVVSWVGPACGHRFEQRVAIMAAQARCPECGATG